ncbi:HNH endonuclease [Pseudomonas sp. Z1-29]
MDVHHTKPSRSTRKGPTRLNDLMLLCSICYRMTHVRLQWPILNSSKH